MLGAGLHFTCRQWHPAEHQGGGPKVPEEAVAEDTIVVSDTETEPKVKRPKRHNQGASKCKQGGEASGSRCGEITESACGSIPLHQLIESFVLEPGEDGSRHELQGRTPTLTPDELWWDEVDRAMNDDEAVGGLFASSPTITNLLPRDEQQGGSQHCDIELSGDAAIIPISELQPVKRRRITGKGSSQSA